MNIAVDKQQ